MNASNTPKPNKKEAVGPDGLTKKERRALKVQSKQPAGVEPPKQEASKEKIASVEPVTSIANDIKSASTAPAKLSEKEQRKLEWQAKLAAEGAKKEKPALSKAELKAKRREQQEAQREAKQTKPVKTEKQPPPQAKATAPIKTTLEVTKTTSKPANKTSSKPHDLTRVELVKHLYCKHLNSTTPRIVNFKNVHPAFVRLGVQYSTKTIIGSNARCLALLAAIDKLVVDLQTPPKQEFCRYLESVLKSCTDHLQECRPMAVSMLNALRQFKIQLTEINNTLSDNEKRAFLRQFISDYIRDDINKAGDAIQMKVNEKITNEDVILTYGCSSLIKNILVKAHNDGKRFQVIVADGRPHLEGREMLRRLVDAGIPCQYVFSNALSNIMSKVSKVLLGAHALLTNGYVMSRIGTAQVALVAQAYNKPVLVCCEKYKFSERVQTDAFVFNEMGDANELTVIDTSKEESPLLGWKDNKKLSPLNMMYDLTPPDFVTAVVTELAILPCTSAPVVLRINAVV